MDGKFQNINFDLDKLPTMPLVAASMMELIIAPEPSAVALTKVVGQGTTFTIERLLEHDGDKCCRM